MHSTIKKLGAILLALTLLFALNATAFAATGPDNHDGNLGSTVSGESTGGTFTTNTTTERWDTAITSTTFNVHFDVVDAYAHTPKTQFSYSISNGTAVAATSTTPEIKAGVTDGAKLPASAVTDAWNSVNADVYVDTIEVTLDRTKFSQPGIYRYVITQADMTAEQTAIGIENGDTSENKTQKVLYLDVYVAKVSGTLSVVAAVMANSTTAPTLSDESGTIPDTLETATYGNKVDGFYNHFHTYTVTLSKTVAGDAGDTDYQFPFKLLAAYTEDNTDANTTITGLTINAAASASTASCAATYTIDTTATGLWMKHGGTITLTGVPKMTIVKLRELISAGDGYMITSAITSMDSPTVISTALNEDDSDWLTFGTVNGGDDDTIAYTNTRHSISPTGVVLRVAPYALMLGAGFIFLMISKRRKEENEA